MVLMLFCEDATNWLDMLDDAVAMIHRLKILKHLLRKCCSDPPPEGCRSSDDTRGKYDGSEMIYLLDESLPCLIQEYEIKIAKRADIITLNNANKTINTVEDKSRHNLHYAMTDQAA